MAVELEYNATLVERLDLAPDLAIFALRPDEVAADEETWFVPGQYTVLGLNTSSSADPDSESVKRPMTMASAAQERERVEFFIRRVADPDSDTPLTHAIWQLREGDRLYLRPTPAGRFTIEDAVGREDRRLKVCVAADTGLAPFASMVRTFRRADPACDLSRFAILHGASRSPELGYHDELSALSRESGLRYFASVADAEDDPEWRGDIGRVEDYFAPGRLEALEERLGLETGGLDPETTVVFACGLRDMISRALRHLAGRGFLPNHRRIRKALEVTRDVGSSLFFEQYDTGPLLDFKDAEAMRELRDRYREAPGYGDVEG